MSIYLNPRLKKCGSRVLEFGNVWKRSACCVVLPKISSVTCYKPGTTAIGRFFAVDAVNLGPRNVYGFSSINNTLFGRRYYMYHKEVEPIINTIEKESYDTEERMKKLIDTVLPADGSNATLYASHSTQRLCDQYKMFSQGQKILFLSVLAREYGYAIKPIIDASSSLLVSSDKNKTVEGCVKELKSLNNSLIPQYDELFEKIHRLSEGFIALIHMRADMLDIFEKDKSLKLVKIMADYLKTRIQTWIIGTLDLKLITWNSPASTIEKLGKYESVHSVRTIKDMKRRLGPGRRCFGFFHKNASLEPLVFVWVAFASEISTNIKEILSTSTPFSEDELKNAKVAIFYSINSQPGIAGVDLGSFLIKRVTSVLQNEFPNLGTFCTLSPMPLFTTWLKKWLTPDICENPDMRITEEEEKVIAGIVPEAKVWTEGLRRILEDREIAKNVETLNQIRSVILKLGARYILKEKRGETKIAFDPVANFHLKNGASVHCINWMADPSSRGIRNSLGLMCNYNYITDAIEKNNAGYLNEGKIAISGTDLIYKSLDF